MTALDVQARVRRLLELSQGLAVEVIQWRRAEDPLLYLERKAYLDALQDTLAATEAARVVLAKALIRMREKV